MDRVQLPQGYRNTKRRQFTFYHKSPEIPSNHLSELRRMKVWVEYGVTQYLSRRKINHDYNNNRSFEGIVNVVKLPSYQNSEKAEWEFLIINLN